MYEILSYDHAALAGESSEKIPWFCAAVLAKNANIIILAVHFWKLVETSMLVVTNNGKTSDSTIYQSQEQDSLHCTTSRCCRNPQGRGKHPRPSPTGDLVLKRKD